MTDSQIIKKFPHIPTEPEQGIQAELSIIYLWNPDIANTLIDKLNEAIAAMSNAKGVIPSYEDLEYPIDVGSSCYYDHNIYSSLYVVGEKPSEFDPTRWKKIGVDGYELTWQLALKQNIIDDLDIIRSGAAAGATAIQSGDNISELTNDAGYTRGSFSAGVELNPADWEDNVLTLSFPSVTSSDSVFVAPQPTSIDLWVSSGVICSAVGTGTLTFTCETVPTDSLGVNIAVFK